MNPRTLQITTLFCVMLLLFSGSARAQKFADSLKWRINIYGSDAIDASTLKNPGQTRLAIHTNANYGPPFDIFTDFTDRWKENSAPGDTELSWPPAPPGLSLWLQNPRVPTLGTVQRTLIHPPPASTIDTFKLVWHSTSIDGEQTGANSDNILRWPSSDVLKTYADSIVLQDKFNTVAHVNLMKDSMFVYNPATSGYDITTLAMIFIVYNPKKPLLPPDSVTTTYPVNGSPGQLASDSVKWQPVYSLPGQTNYYRVQVANDRTFKAGSIVLVDSLAATARAYSGFAPGKWYYWRVKAFTQYGVGIYKTIPDSFFVGIPTPTKLNLIAPSLGQTNVSNTPTLLWHRFPFGTMSYRVQLSSTANFSVLIGDSTLADTSCTFPTSLADCDTFYWRVHGQNEGGTGPDSASSFRAHFAVPVTPTQLRIPDGSLGVPTQGVRLSWVGKDVCTDQWRVQVATDSLFANLFVNSTFTDTFAIVNNLLGLKTYYWHVRSENAAQQSPYSSRWSFTTKLGPPNVPTLVSPADHANTGVSGTLTWNTPLNNPTGYRIELSTSPTVAPPFVLVDSTLTDTTRAFGPLVGCTTYYWHVRASNDSGVSAFSAIRSFNAAQTAPDTVALLLPADGATNQPQNTTMTWSSTGACPATYYIFEITTDPTFTTIALRESLLVATKTYGPLLANTQYYWRVTSGNSTGLGNSRQRSFRSTALTAPPKPVLASPPNGIGGVSLAPVLAWDTTARAHTWRLQVAFDSLFTRMVFNDSTLTAPQHQIGPLLDSTWYYWRVNAKNDSGTSLFSDVWRFYTMAPPGMPALYSPAYGQIDVPVVPTFVWTLPSGTSAFQLQVAKDSLFTALMFDDSTITTTSKTLSVWLKGFTSYYWRVRAKNVVGWSPYTPVWRFRTARVGAANWWFPLSVAETGPQRDTIYMGIHPLATYGIDPSLGELALPQLPPVGNFDLRFIDIPSRPSLLGEGTRLNFLPFNAYAQVDTFHIRFQPGVGSYPMTVSWPQRFVKDICDSMLIVDEFGGLTVHKWMQIDSTVTVTNSALNTLLIIEYGAFPTGVKRVSDRVPKGYALQQNYPNPFNPTTQIRFSADHPSHVKLEVFDMLGRSVVTLTEGQFPVGEYSVTWDGRNANSMAMPSGVYYVRMIAITTSAGGQSAPFVATRKMLMMK